MAALFLCVWGLRAVLQRWALARGWLACIVLWALALGWVAVEHNRDYQTRVSAWKTTAMALPENPRAHANLANALQAEGRRAEALKHYRQSIELRPAQPRSPAKRATL